MIFPVTTDDDGQISRHESQVTTIKARHNHRLNLYNLTKKK